MTENLIDYLAKFASPDRIQLFDKVLQERTRYLTVVLEDIYHSQNASAVLRTCDCLGIQDVHIIEEQNKFNLNRRVTLGAAKWLNLYHYNAEQNNTRAAIRQLKTAGYRIVATVPQSNSVSLENFDLEKGKTALIFGSEKPGISQTVKEEADEFLTIPMVGFTESLNLSVSAAIILYHLTSKLKGSAIGWQLSPAESSSLKLEWLRGSIKSSDLIEKEYHNRRSGG